MDRIDKIISDGGPIDGIGFQSRFKYGPVDQDEVIKRIDDFSTRYPDFQLAGTEFEIKDGRDYLYTELERARMTEEILTTYYSHENMVGLNAWDFMSASSDPDTTEITAAMAWYDGRIKLNGLVWYYLHRIRYSTDVRLESDHTGTVTVPAHKGDYLVSVTHNNETYFAEVTLTGNRVLEFEVEPGFQINAGLSDAWFNPSTSGQGFFITVLPDHGVVTLAWFTYDTQLPSEDASAELGDPGHRWLTATGPYQENQSIMNVEMTSGGLFDSAAEIQRTDPPGSDGNIILKFANCEEATVKYSIPSVGLSGLIPIVRVAADNIPLCQALTGLPDVMRQSN